MKQLQKELLALLGERVSVYGFQKKPVGQSFLKQIPCGRVSFHLAFINHQDDFDVTADIAIRFDDLENLISAGDKLLTKKEKALTYSLGAEIGNIAHGAQKRWRVNTVADIPGVVDAILLAFEKYALPYYERYSVMQNALELLSKNDRAAWIHCPLHAARAKRALGLAVLLGHKNLVAQMIKDSTSFLQEVKDFGLRDYVEFSKKLIE